MRTLCSRCDRKNRTAFSMSELNAWPEVGGTEAFVAKRRKAGKRECHASRWALRGPVQACSGKRSHLSARISGGTCCTRTSLLVCAVPSDQRPVVSAYLGRHLALVHRLVSPSSTTISIHITRTTHRLAQFTQQSAIRARSSGNRHGQSQRAMNARE